MPKRADAKAWKGSPQNDVRLSGLMIWIALIAMMMSVPVLAETLSPQALVTPSTTILKDGRPGHLALHGFIEFKCWPSCPLHQVTN